MLIGGPCDLDARDGHFENRFCPAYRPLFVRFLTADGPAGGPAAVSAQGPSGAFHDGHPTEFDLQQLQEEAEGHVAEGSSPEEEGSEPQEEEEGGMNLGVPEDTDN